MCSCALNPWHYRLVFPLTSSILSLKLLSQSKNNGNDSYSNCLADQSWGSWAKFHGANEATWNWSSRRWESCLVLSYHHFRSMLRLCGEGLNPQKYGIDGYVTKIECIKLWGPRKWHNGFKFKVDGNPPELKAKIRHLNIVIYQKS